MILWNSGSGRVLIVPGIPARKVSQGITTKARGTLAEDDKIEVTSDFSVDNTEHLWGRPSGWRPFLRSGRYVVAIRFSRGDLLLAEADWDPSGRITFSSAQHTYIVRGRGVSALLAKFRV